MSLLSLPDWPRRATVILFFACCLPSFAHGRLPSHDAAKSSTSQQHEQPGTIKNPTSDPTCLENYWSLDPECAQNSKSDQKYCLFTSSTFADNRGISILTSPEHAQELVKLPAFANPYVHRDLEVNQLPHPPFVAKEIQDHGIGLVANRTIMRGECLMSVTPAFMMHHTTYEDLSSYERLKLQRLAFQRVPDRLRNLSENLFGEGDGDNLIDDIFIVNSFGFAIGAEQDWVVGDWNPQTVYRILFPEIARLNHGCRPSANVYFDTETLTLHIVAVRDIFPGEELTISYIDPLQSRRERLEALNRSWRFKCDCFVCTAPPKVSDASEARISKLIQLQTELTDYTGASKATPTTTEEYISLLKQERLWTMLHSAYVTAAYEYNGVGDTAKAQMYARLALRSGFACRGPNDSDDNYRNMVGLMKEPRRHSSYMFRVR